MNKFYHGVLMANRPTIQDLAAEAKVSVATVDRVLNGRSRVREETARQVLEAARKLNYHGASLILQRIQEAAPEYRFGIILHKEKQDFFQNLASRLRETAAEIPRARIKLDIAFAENQSASEYARLITALGRRNQALAAIAIDHQMVAAAVEEVRARNVPVFAILSDFAQDARNGYIGLNNVRVGRGTAYILSRMAKPGKAALFVGGHRWQGHEMREAGFRSYFREYAPEFQMIDTLVNLETRQLTYEATVDLLDRNKDLTVLYCAGGGMEGAIEAIRELRAPQEVALAVNEDTAISRQALRDRYLTMVNVTPLPRFSHDLMLAMIDSIRNPGATTAMQSFINHEFLFPETI